MSPLHAAADNKNSMNTPNIRFIKELPDEVLRAGIAIANVPSIEASGKHSLTKRPVDDIGNRAALLVGCHKKQQKAHSVLE